jgi:EPS-associated MarR family transcriptional regulator
MSSELQFRVLRLLETNPHFSQRELSKSLGVSLGGVNYCLNALIAKGAVKIENFKNNQNKWVYAYLLTPQGIAEKTALTGSFLKRKMQEYEQLKQEIESLTLEVGPVVAVEAAEIALEIASKTSQEETLNVKAGGGVNG